MAVNKILKDFEVFADDPLRLDSQAEKCVNIVVDKLNKSIHNGFLSVGYHIFLHSCVVLLCLNKFFHGILFYLIKYWLFFIILKISN